MAVVKTPKAGDPAPTPPNALWPRIWKEKVDKRSGKTRLVIGTTHPGRPDQVGEQNRHKGEAGRLHFAKIRLLKTVHGRGGIPNGFDRKGFTLLLDEGIAKAKKAIEHMEAKDQIDLSGVPADEVEKEKSALTFAAGMVLSPSVPLALRLKAADVTLKYTRGARQNTNLKVEDAEALLAAALKDAGEK